MGQTHWQPATLAAALGVPEEAFRAFARLRQIAWEKELSPPEGDQVEARFSCAAA